MMGVKEARQKHVPQRSCLVCRQKTDKRLLTRLVRTPDNGVVADPTGKINGRGAYLCHRSTCWDKALKGPPIHKALHTEITASEKEMLATHRPQELS